MITAADVEYSDATDIMALGNRLVDDQGNLHIRRGKKEKIIPAASLGITPAVSDPDKGGMS